ncbi:MAG TPA: hypothetical protein ENJ06_02455 [Phycisphaeraceae bacterium]|nr:hypothetical protein [Phycisphaeraceae bacterium]
MNKLNHYISLFITLIPVLVCGCSGVPAPSERTVHFSCSYETGAHEAVFVTGETPELGGNDITRALKMVPEIDDGSLRWSLNVYIPRGGDIKYKYLLRDDRIDRLCDTANGKILSMNDLCISAGGNPRLDAVKIPVKTGEIYRGSITGYVIETQHITATENINSKKGRGVQVYLPPGYYEHPQARYPVLYMHDGQNCFREGGPFGSWKAEQVADQLIADSQIEPIIIVAVDNSPDRFAEYVPRFSRDHIVNDNYNLFLTGELKPWVDSHFRTLPDPAHTAILGSSLGGIASLIAGLDYSDTYGIVGAMSPSLWTGTTMRRLLRGELPGSVRLYLDAGDSNDGAEAVFFLRDELLRRGRVLNNDLAFELGCQQRHNEAAWHARLPRFLRFAFPVRAG